MNTKRLTFLGSFETSISRESGVVPAPFSPEIHLPHCQIYNAVTLWEKGIRIISISVEGTVYMNSRNHLTRNNRAAKPQGLGAKTGEGGGFRNRDPDSNLVNIEAVLRFRFSFSSVIKYLFGPRAYWAYPLSLNTRPKPNWTQFRETRPPINSTYIVLFIYCYYCLYWKIHICALVVVRF